MSEEFVLKKAPKQSRKSSKRKSTRSSKERKEIKRHCGYKVIRELGTGSYGQVLLVQDDQGKQWALKLAKSVSPTKKEINQMEVTEGAINATLRHPYVMTSESVFLDCAQPLTISLLQEVADAGDLFHYLQKHQLHGLTPLQLQQEIIQRVFFVHDLSCALRFLHLNGILQHDFKPENVLLFTNQTGRRRLIAKVHDFGLSSVILGEPTFAGTRMFLSPEVLCGGIYTPAADFWSLGVTALEMFFGIELTEAIPDAADNLLFDQPTLSEEDRRRLTFRAIVRARGTPPDSWFTPDRLLCSKSITPAIPRRSIPALLDATAVIQRSRFDTRYWRGLYTSAVFDPLVALIDGLLSYDPDQRSPTIDRELPRLFYALALPTSEFHCPVASLQVRVQEVPFDSWLDRLDVKGGTDILKKYMWTIWTRLQCVDPVKYQETRIDTDLIDALTSLAQKILGIRKKTPSSPAVLNKERQIMSDLAFNFYGALPAQCLAKLSTFAASSPSSSSSSPLSALACSRSSLPFFTSAPLSPIITPPARPPTPTTTSPISLQKLYPPDIINKVYFGEFLFQDVPAFLSSLF